MKIFIIIILYFSFVCKQGLGNQNLIAEFLDNQIEIDVGFTGKKLSYFGAIDTQGDLVIIVTGPRKKIKVFKKERKVWFWINSGSRILQMSHHTQQQPADLLIR